MIIYHEMLISGQIHQMPMHVNLNSKSESWVSQECPKSISFTSFSYYYGMFIIIWLSPTAYKILTVNPYLSNLSSLQQFLTQPI